MRSRGCRGHRGGRRRQASKRARGWMGWVRECVWRVVEDGAGGGERHGARPINARQRDSDRAQSQTLARRQGVRQDSAVPEVFLQRFEPASVTGAGTHKEHRRGGRQAGRGWRRLRVFMQALGMAEGQGMGQMVGAQRLRRHMRKPGVAQQQRRRPVPAAQRKWRVCRPRQRPRNRRQLLQRIGDVRGCCSSRPSEGCWLWGRRWPRCRRRWSGCAAMLEGTALCCRRRSSSRSRLERVVGAERVVGRAGWRQRMREREGNGQRQRQRAQRLAGRRRGRRAGRRRRRQCRDSGDDTGGRG